MVLGRLYFNEPLSEDLVVDYSIWSKRVNEWQCKLEKEDLTKDERWMLESVSKLVSMAIESDQDYIPKDGYIECDRVVKLRKYIPNYEFVHLNVEKVLLSGVYVKVRGVLLSAKWVEENSYIRKGVRMLNSGLNVMFPDCYIPSLKELHNGCYFIMKRGGISEYLQYGSQYEYFRLSDSGF